MTDVYCFFLGALKYTRFETKKAQTLPFGATHTYDKLWLI